MTEAEARMLADEINRHPSWTAWAEEQPLLRRDNPEWVVKAHHDAMRRHGTLTNPRPVEIISSREEWDAARDSWQ
jgi:hypothetical protein